MFAQALTETIRRLEEAKARGLVEQYALIGGFAVSAWGVPRASQDLDFALVLGSHEPALLAQSLEADFHAGDSSDPLRGVFKLTIPVEDYLIPVQCILLPVSWVSVIFSDVVPLSLFGISVPVVSWQSLILLKLYAGGPQDLLDAQQILAVRRPTQPELQALFSLAQRVGVTETWQSIDPR